MQITIRQLEGRGMLQQLATRLPQLTAKAATETAWQIRKAEQEHFRAVLDRPRPAVISAVRVQRAVAGAQGSSAAVYVGHPDPGFQRRLDVALGLQESGGRLTAGDLGRKRIAVPVGVPLDGNGGMRRGFLRRLTARKKVFVGRVGAGNGKPGTYGIYERLTALGPAVRGPKGRFGKRVRASGVRLLVALERTTEYRRPKLKFYQVAEKTCRKVFPMELARALGRAASR